jgi:MFS family permease
MGRWGIGSGALGAVNPGDNPGDNPAVNPGGGPSPAYRGYVLFVLFLVAVFNTMDRLILSVLQDAIKDDFSLTDEQLGLLSISFSIAFIVFGLPLGRLGDRWPRRTIIACCLGWWSLMTASCGLAGTLGQLALARAGVGSGEAGSFHTSHSILSDLFSPRRRPLVMALFSSGVPLGIMLANVAGGMILEAFGDWRWAFLLVGVPGLALAALVGLTIEEPQRGLSEQLVDSGRAPPLATVCRYLWTIRSFRYAMLGVAFQAISWYGIYHWLPSVFQRAYALSAREAGLQVGILFGVTGSIGMIGAGVLSMALSRRDRRWYLWLCALAVSIQVPFVAVALMTSSKNLSLVCLTVPMLAAGFFTVVPVTVAQGVAPLRMRGTADAIRIFLAMTLVGLAFGHYATGLLSDTLRPLLANPQESLSYALLLTVVVANVISAVCYATGARTLAEDIDRATEENRLIRSLQGT